MSGLDSSSSASIAAYVSDISRSLVGKEGNWFLGRLSSPWRISSAVVCCWNAFSKVDVRVEVSIPGGVNSYCVDPLTGMSVPTTPSIWQETFVSSMLRTISWKGDDERGLNRIDTFPPGSDTEDRFLEACKGLFWDGWQLGSVSSGSPQMANSTNNRLAQGLLAYFTEVSQTPLKGVEFFESLAQQDPLVNELVIRCLFEADQEHKSVTLAHKTVTQDPRKSASILRLQAEWLLTKGEDELETAEKLVRFSIQLAPLDLDGWVRLADIQLRRGQYEEALSTLNSFPPYIIGSQSSESPSSQQSNNTAYWQPRNDFTMVDLSAIEPTNKRDSPLEHLRSPYLRGATSAAYALLARILDKVGWDGLLEKRAAVFVMEEDWVQVKRSTSHHAEDSDDKGLLDDIGKLNLSDGAGPSSSTEGPISPQKARVSSPQPAKQISTMIGKKKKLCERWLDSLFMVLFEDLRLLTLYQAERSVAQSEGRVYRRTPREWLLLGKLCSRLCQQVEAKEAYERCLDTGFSRGAWIGLLQDWTGSKDKLSHALTACIHLASDSVNRRERPTHPSAVSTSLRKLVAMHGLAKVKEALQLLKPCEPTTQFIEELISVDRISDCNGSNF